MLCVRSGKKERTGLEKAKGVGAFTLIEMIFSIVLIIIVSAVVGGALITVLQANVSQQGRTNIRFQLSMGLEREIRLLHHGKALQISFMGGDENKLDTLRVTIPNVATGGEKHHAYYFFHPSDTCPPNYNQELYELKRVDLPSIGASFSCGAGRRIIQDIMSPPKSHIKLGGPANAQRILFTLFVKQKDEVFTLRSATTPRNALR